MHIGLLQTGHVADNLQARNGDYPEIFARFLEGQGLRLTNYAVVDDQFPPGPEAADGWLITGSRFGVYEGYPWIDRLEAFIRDICASGKPLVGICFGHQVIARALGGKVEKFAGGWSVGPTDYTIAGRTYTINAWHQDQITALPPGADVICSTDFCANAALLYGDQVFTLQPHPEIDRTYMQDLIEIRGPGIVPGPILAQASGNLDKPVDRKDLAEMIARFLKERRLA